MYIQMIALLVTVVCFLLSAEASPLSLQNQLQVALQQLAELKGDGNFDNCCNVSPTSNSSGIVCVIVNVSHQSY